MSDITKIRELKTNIIGYLVAITGTITKSTEVRPELLVGTFECKLCGYIIRGIEQ